MAADQRPKDYNHQFPHNDGLCLFWSPDFGVSLLTKNWGAARDNTLLVKVGEGKVLWPWYLDAKTVLNAEQGLATMTGTIHGTSLTYQRDYRCLGRPDRGYTDGHVARGLHVRERQRVPALPPGRPQARHHGQPRRGRWGRGALGRSREQTELP